MLRFLMKRFFYSIFAIIGISILIFVLARVIPGDPARLVLGEMVSQEAVDDLREKMHLNDPVYIQYYYWFSNILKGDFGMSLNNSRPVVEDIKAYFPATLELIILAAMIQLIFGFLLGLLSSIYKDTWIDGTLRLTSYIGISVPPFVLATILILFFGHIWTVLPVLGRLSMGMEPPLSITGMYIFDFSLAGNYVGALDAFYHALLPALSLATATTFIGARVLRSSIIDNMGKEYITVERSFGIPNNRIFYKYLLKPSAAPFITIAGLNFGNTLGRAFIVETVFNWPGFSRYTLTAMLTKDLNAISVGIIIIGFAYVSVNIIVDIVNAAIDPEERLG